MSAAHTAKPGAGKLPHSFHQIRLELAREKGQPEGAADHGYTIFAQIDKNNRIDSELWRSYRDNCRVVRFRPAEDEAVGHLIHRPGGSWAFHYDIRGEKDDEAGYHLENERFEIGEYVSIREDDAMHTFRVTSVQRI